MPRLQALRRTYGLCAESCVEIQSSGEPRRASEGSEWLQRAMKSSAGLRRAMGEQLRRAEEGA
eukprot:9638338-Alexandrium_andersonii.AAC.1